MYICVFVHVHEVSLEMSSYIFSQTKYLFFAFFKTWASMYCSASWHGESTGCVKYCSAFWHGGSMGHSRVLQCPVAQRIVTCSGECNRAIVLAMSCAKYFLNLC